MENRSLAVQASEMEEEQIPIQCDAELEERENLMDGSWFRSYEARVFSG